MYDKLLRSNLSSTVEQNTSEIPNNDVPEIILHSRAPLEQKREATISEFVQRIEQSEKLHSIEGALIAFNQAWYIEGIHDALILNAFIAALGTFGEQEYAMELLNKVVKEQPDKIGHAFNGWTYIFMILTAGKNGDIRLARKVYETIPGPLKSFVKEIHFLMKDIASDLYTTRKYPFSEARIYMHIDAQIGQTYQQENENKYEAPVVCPTSPLSSMRKQQEYEDAIVLTLDTLATAGRTRQFDAAVNIFKDAYEHGYIHPSISNGLLRALAYSGDGEYIDSVYKELIDDVPYTKNKPNKDESTFKLYAEIHKRLRKHSELRESSFSSSNPVPTSKQYHVMSPPTDPLVHRYWKSAGENKTTSSSMTQSFLVTLEDQRKMEPQRPQQASTSTGTSLFGLMGNSSQVAKQDDDIVSLLSEIDTLALNGSFNNDDADSLVMQYADGSPLSQEEPSPLLQGSIWSGSRQNPKAGYDWDLSTKFYMN